MNWSACDAVESDPAKVSGAWVVKGTRVQADAILVNAKSGFSAEAIATTIFPSVSVEHVRRVLDFARENEAHPA